VLSKTACWGKPEPVRDLVCDRVIDQVGDIVDEGLCASEPLRRRITRTGASTERHAIPARVGKLNENEKI